jgi:hypothetical protein
MGNIANIGMNFDQMLLNANYGGVGGQADALGAIAQANSGAAIGQMNAQSQQNSAIMGGLGMMGGMALGGPLGGAFGKSLFGGG